MKTTIRRSNGKIEFFRGGKQVFDFTISGNIVKFSTGEIILL